MVLLRPDERNKCYWDGTFMILIELLSCWVATGLNATTMVLRGTDLLSVLGEIILSPQRLAYTIGFVRKVDNQTVLAFTELLHNL